MSFFKYYQERQDTDGEKLWWPGGPDGFPFRGRQPPQTTQAEYENLQLTGKFRCKLFHLAVEEELALYTTVRDKCTNGFYVPVDKDRQWDEETKNYRIYLEWVEPAYELPPNLGVTDAIKNAENAAPSITVPFSKLAGLGPSW